MISRLPLERRRRLQLPVKLAFDQETVMKLRASLRFRAKFTGLWRFLVARVAQSRDKQTAV
jgi:hypothetical protein